MSIGHAEMVVQSRSGTVLLTSVRDGGVHALGLVLGS